MTARIGNLLVAAALCAFGSGCVVRSVHPWLGDETKAADAALVGAWQDAEHDQTAFFVKADGGEFEALFVSNKKDLSRFKVSVHRLEGVLLMMVGPVDREGIEAVTLLPAHLIYRLELEPDAMRIYGINLDSFDKTLKESGLKSMDGGGKKDGYVLLSDTAALAGFLKAHVKDAGFFDQKPMYCFRKISVK